METCSILVVDDNPGLTDVLSLILEDRGFQVDIASTGTEALEKLKARPYRLAFVDVRLPDTTGIALLPEIRSIRPEIDCVVITAHCSAETAVDALNLGAYAYLVKPVDPAELLATVDRVLERQHLREQLHNTNRILQTLVNAVDSGILLVGPGGEIRFANRKAERMLGVDQGAVDGRDATSVFLQAFSDRVADSAALKRSLTAHCPDGGSVAETQWEIRKPERCVLHRYCAAVTSDDGLPLGRVEVYSDVTRQTELLEHERRIAEMLQRSILPEVPAAIAGMEIATLYRAALDEARIGGDFYDVFPVGNRRIMVVIGDVSGKGLAAAMHTAMTRHALRSYAFEDPSPASVLLRLNRLMCAQNEWDSFATLFCALLDLDEGSLRYVCAGHEPSFLWHPDDAAPEPLTSGGPAIGAIPRAEYEQGEVVWKPGSVLLLYTDGASEVRQDGRFLGAAGVGSLFARYAGAGCAQTIADRVFEGVLQFAAGHLRDDTALLVVRSPLR